MSRHSLIMYVVSNTHVRSPTASQRNAITSGRLPGAFSSDFMPKAEAGYRVRGFMNHRGSAVCFLCGMAVPLSSSRGWSHFPDRPSSHHRSATVVSLLLELGHRIAPGSFHDSYVWFEVSTGDLQSTILPLRYVTTTPRLMMEMPLMFHSVYIHNRNDPDPLHRSSRCCKP